MPVRTTRPWNDYSDYVTLADGRPYEYVYAERIAICMVEGGLTYWEAVAVAGRDYTELLRGRSQQWPGEVRGLAK